MIEWSGSSASGAGQAISRLAANLINRKFAEFALCG